MLVAKTLLRKNISSEIINNLADSLKQQKGFRLVSRRKIYRNYYPMNHNSMLLSYQLLIASICSPLEPKTMFLITRKISS
ncbi:hypothetical protein FGO68_gene9893 [Halteria grandinella]|uniref:Uncharacterized protein n=1 Tax=Halteria grandinella TaxID=5974 RepID=A0A8J8NPU1_HALGN|nr:hypothetical protein FGO68_gene9893 [Halteria grandinella]